MVRLKNEIYMDGELVFDHIKLQPDVQDVNGLGFMEEYTRIGYFIVISEEILEEKRQFRGSFFAIFWKSQLQKWPNSANHAHVRHFLSPELTKIGKIGIKLSPKKI